jgi:hypothetical protein
MLSANDQDIASRVFEEAESVTKSESRDDIDKALTALERVAGQLTSAMMNPTDEATTAESTSPSSEFTKF